MKRSVNFTGSRATVARKAQSPESIIATFRHLGLSDAEIRDVLEKMQTKLRKTADRKEG